MRERRLDAPGETATRRAAVSDLGEAVRELVLATVRTEVPLSTIHDAVAAAREVTALLAERARPVHQVAAVDDLLRGIRHYSPVTGAGHPSAPPMRLREDPGGALTGVATLDTRFEGPPGHLHGGVAALLLDEMLGLVAIRHGGHGLTASLELTYVRATPLDEEIVVGAEVTERSGRKIWVEGWIATAVEPDCRNVTARALFIEPRAELAHAYFNAIVDADGWPVPTPSGWRARNA